MSQIPIEVVQLISKFCAILYPSESRRSVLTVSRAFFEWVAPVVFASVTINSRNLYRLVDLAERYHEESICARHVTTLVVPAQLITEDLSLFTRARPPPLGRFNNINTFVGSVEALLQMVTNGGPFKLTRLYIRGRSYDPSDSIPLLHVLNGPWSLVSWSITSVTRLRITHPIDDMLAIVQALPKVFNITYDPLAVDFPPKYFVEGIQKLLRRSATVRRLKIVIRREAMIGMDNQRLSRQIALFELLKEVVGRNDARLFLVQTSEDIQDQSNWKVPELQDVWEPV